MSNYLEEWMREKYDSTAEQYRRDDEIDATGSDHHQLCATLRDICLSFKTALTVLDIGCGTGRHFHCLCNVERLVGIDISQGMLDQASHPIKRDDTPVRKEFICASFYSHPFDPGSFDLIYSIGVFGNGCGINPDLCGKFVRWLKPNGVLFFDVLDSASLPPKVRIRKRLRSWVYRLLPRWLQEKWDKRNGWVPAFLATESELNKMLLGAGFEDVLVHRRLCKLPGGEGWKLQCRAIKSKIAAMTTMAILPFAHPRTTTLVSTFEGLV